MPRIPDDEASRRLQQIPGWTRTGDAIARTWKFAAFPHAVGFVVRVGFDAETADHHPDIQISYTRVTLTYTTHSAGGLTGKDFDAAARVTAIAGESGGA